MSEKPDALRLAKRLEEAGTSFGNEVAAELRRLQAEVEALRQDAERIDYLQSVSRCDPKMDGKHVWWPTSFKVAQTLKGPTLREAIDAAIAEHTNADLPPILKRQAS